MKKEYLEIEKIPAVIWGNPSQEVIIAVHGNMSHKEDTVIDMLAQVAIQRGYQVLSFDLPEHGDRKNEATLCKVERCVYELGIIMKYAQEHYSKISLFACSLGAYLSMMTYHDEKTLQDKKEIDTPIGQTLYWDYYCYVKEHPIIWRHYTKILYGDHDEMCERDILDAFVANHHCELTVRENGEHFFHTPEQLKFYKEWLNGHV